MTTARERRLRELAERIERLERELAMVRQAAELTLATPEPGASTLFSIEPAYAEEQQPVVTRVEPRSGQWARATGGGN